MNTSSFSIKDAVGFGWVMMKEKFLFLFALLLISGFFSVLPDVTAYFTYNSVVLFMVQVLALVLGFVVDAGLIYLMLRLRDGQETKILDVFSQYPIAFRYFVAVVWYGLMIGGLPVLFIAYVNPAFLSSFMAYENPLQDFNPQEMVIIFSLCVLGAYVMLRYQFYKYFLVDKRVTVVESFSESARITDGHKWQLLRFIAVLFGINLPGLIGLTIFTDLFHMNGMNIVALLLGLSLFVTIPLAMLATAYVYRSLSAPIVEPEPLEKPEVILEPLPQSASLDEKVSQPLESLTISE